MGQQGCLNAGFDSELCQDTPHVGPDRGMADEKPASDFRIRQALGEQGKHLAFRGGEVEAAPSLQGFG